MGVADDIIKKLKDIKWEEASRAEIETERVAVAAVKMVPFVTGILKEFLRNQLTGPGGHAKDALAKRMFNHYLDKSGALFVLKLDDMKAMNNPQVPNHDGINIKMLNASTPNPNFLAMCALAKTTGTPQEYSGKMNWIWDNGAIANYTVNYKGKITATGGVCTWEGTVDYFDIFDLDPRWGWTPANPQGRSRGGERRTRIGYILNLGTDYEMKSPKANVTQREDQTALNFGGSIVPGSTPSAGDL